MEVYEALIKLKSSTLTDFQSDTLFGHFCWFLYYTKGEKELTQFLDDQMKDGGIFALSSVFPEGAFPKPTLKPMSITERDELNDKYFEGDILEAARAFKDFKKPKYIPQDLLEKHINNLSEKVLVESYFEAGGKEVWDDANKTDHTAIEQTIRHTRNRYTLTVIEGRLFDHRETFIKDNLRLLFSSDFIPEEDFAEFLDYLSHIGFGKRKTTGKGQIEIVKEPTKITFPKAQNPNAFITLSNYVPADGDPVEGTYDIFTKYPKVGAELAVSAGGCWKKPLMMFAPGSVFHINGNRKDVYGSLVGDIYPPKKEVVQFACAFPLEVRLS